MKKQILLICQNNQQFGVVVDELSASKTAKRIIADLSNPSKQFICFADYLISKDPNQGFWVRASVVSAVIIAEVSNIQVPNKNIFVPGGVN